MAAGDVTITRGVGFRDDMLDLTTGSWLAGQTANVTASLSDDGDGATLNTTFTSAVSGNKGFAASGNYVNALSTTTYPKLIVRHKESSAATNPDYTVTVNFSDSSTQTLTLTKTTSYLAEVFTLTSGKGVNGFNINITANASLNGTFTLTWDFIFIFKEVLTLPSVSQPLQLSLPRTLVELPIPSREGGVLQDLGSESANLELAGTLITSTAPTNYTGEQWWDVLVGTWIEANWQWLASDRVSYKYQIQELTVRQDPGKVGYYEFKMRLRKVDILSATAQTFGAIQ